MSMRRPDPQLQRAWRSKPPRSQRLIQGALAVVAAVAVGIAGALVVRSCNGEADGGSTPILPPLTTLPTTTLATTTSTTTTVVLATYVVQRGDSLFAIAIRHGVTMAELIELNGIEDPDRIEAGQVLKLPPGATTTTSSPTTVSLTPAPETSDAPVSTTAAP